MGAFPPQCDFTCTQCGACCRWPGHVLLTDADIDRLARARDLAVYDFVQRYTRLASNRAQLALVDGMDGACIFLREARCTVYDARPEQCRCFPFLATTPEECPGLRRRPAPGP